MKKTLLGLVAVFWVGCVTAEGEPHGDLSTPPPQYEQRRAKFQIAQSDRAQAPNVFAELALRLCPPNRKSRAATDLQKFSTLYEIDTRLLQPLAKREDPESRKAFILAIKLAGAILKSPDEWEGRRGGDPRVFALLGTLEKDPRSVPGSPPVPTLREAESWLETSIGLRVSQEYQLRVCPERVFGYREARELIRPLAGREAESIDEPEKFFGSTSSFFDPSWSDLKPCWVTTANELGVSLWVEKFRPDEWENVSELLTTWRRREGVLDVSKNIKVARMIHQRLGEKATKALVADRPAARTSLSLSWVAGLDLPIGSLTDLAQSLDFLSQSRPDPEINQDLSALLQQIIRKSFPEIPPESIPPDKRLFKILSGFERPGYFFTVGSVSIQERALPPISKDWKDFADDAFAILPEAAVDKLMQKVSEVRQRDLLKQRYKVFQQGLHVRDFAQILRDSRLKSLDYVPLSEALALDLAHALPEKTIPALPYSQAGHKVFFDYKSLEVGATKPTIQREEKPNFPLWIKREALLGLLAEPKLKKHLSPATVKYYREIERFLFPKP